MWLQTMTWIAVPFTCFRVKHALKRKWHESAPGTAELRAHDMSTLQRNSEWQIRQKVHFRVLFCLDCNRNLNEWYLIEVSPATRIVAKAQCALRSDLDHDYRLLVMSLTIVVSNQIASLTKILNQSVNYSVSQSANRSTNCLLARSLGHLFAGPATHSLETILQSVQSGCYAMFQHAESLIPEQCQGEKRLCSPLENMHAWWAQDRQQE